MSCNKCTHDVVCAHKQAYESFKKKVNDAMPGEEMAVMGDKYPFAVEASCKFFAEQEKIIRDRLPQQQYATTSGSGSSNDLLQGRMYQYPSWRL